MRIYVPDMELVGTLKFAHDIYGKVPNDEVVFDFSQMRNFDPLPMLIMGATMRNYRMQYPEIPLGLMDVKGKVMQVQWAFLNMFLIH